MITVSILINGNAIATRSAVNVGLTPEEKSIYKLDDGATILHRREHGAVALAIEMLKSIKEVGAKQPNGELCDGGRRASELNQDANRHSQK